MLSESEGWPKAVTEGMFWGTVPIATPVSCVPMILGHGRRGALVEPTAEDVCRVVLDYLEGRRDYHSAAEEAAHWSRRYTLEALSELIRGVLDSLAHEGTPNC
ncbi:MAG: glycosyltransferase [Kiritimatiellia bacterium]